MGLLLAMLPVYLLGNLHCIGMCGPLVMMIGNHRFRYFYFLGRLASYTLAGALAGEAGAVLAVTLKEYHIPALTSFIFGGAILWIGLSNLFGWRIQLFKSLTRFFSGVSRSLSILILKDRAWPTFLFGFFTVALPCGQTLLVFSASALSGDMLTGLINGFAFALLTSPSLFFAMHTHTFLQKVRRHYNLFVGIGGIIIGILAMMRGFAEMELIDHMVLNPDAPVYTHIVLY